MSSEQPNLGALLQEAKQAESDEVRKRLILHAKSLIRSSIYYHNEVVQQAAERLEKLGEWDIEAAALANEHGITESDPTSDD